MSDKREKSCLYLLCGLPCAGKTTFANGLAEEKEAVLLSLDQLVLNLFPEEDNVETHRKYVQRVETTFFPIVRDLLHRRCHVVLDFPGHTKVERDRLRQIAIQIDAEVCLYYLRAEIEAVRQRIQYRNANLKNREYLIPDWLLSMIIQKFEPPDDTENPIELELEW
jgi:predicted kinase